MTLQKATSEFAVPAARLHDLVTTESKDEVLVYDQETHHIHHLNHTAAAVWNLCDGQRTVSDLAQAAVIDEDAVRLALRKLEDAKLLDGPLSTEMRGAAQSRRAFMKRAAVAGAIAVPAIVSMSAPQAASANSACVDDCTLIDLEVFPGRCCNGLLGGVLEVGVCVFSSTLGINICLL